MPFLIYAASMTCTAATAGLDHQSTESRLLPNEKWTFVDILNNLHALLFNHSCETTHTEGQSSDDGFWHLAGWSGTNAVLGRDTEQVRVSLQQFADTHRQFTGWHRTADHPHAGARTSSSSSGDVTLLDDVLDDW